jgi:GWxTD domain-containing protein
MKVIILILFTSFAMIGLHAQEDEKVLTYAVDLNRFRYSDSLTYVEFSAALNRSDIQYISKDDKYRGEFIVTAEVAKEDSVHARKEWTNVNEVDSLAEITSSQRLYCLNHFVLKPDDYTFRINIKDPNSGLSKEYSSAVSVNDYASGQLRISDIQMSTNIQRDTAKTIFTKNGYRIYPNPSGLYGIGLPILYCYSEIYHLATATTDSGANYKVAYAVLDSDGNVVKTYQPKIKKKPGNSSVEVNGLNVVTLVSGQYFLRMDVTDIENGGIASSAKKFFVYREGDFAEGGAAFKKKEVMSGEGSPGLDASRYAVMTKKELDKEFDYARYIAIKNERDTYKKLNLDGKREYIKQFWARRDQTPGTPDNEFKRDYLQRVEIANQSYRGTFRDGWRTDRGRILLVYGRPDEIERFPFSNENKAYEIWHFFSVQGGVEFFFVDRREMGDLELVHSTARGELYDPDWTRWIDPNQ